MLYRFILSSIVVFILNQLNVSEILSIIETTINNNDYEGNINDNCDRYISEK